MTLMELISLFSRYTRGLNEFRASQMCGLAEGTNSHTLKTTAKIIYTVYNQEVSKAVTDNIAMTACAAQIASTFCYYLVSINQAGSVTVTKGTNDTYALPSTPVSDIPIGAFKVVTDAVTSFTSGTTDLSAAGLTVSFYDIDCGMAVSLINMAMNQLERGVTIVHNRRTITVANWSHMLVRADATALAAGDTSVTLPFSRFKCFADNGVTIKDGGNFITRLEKRDIVPLDTDVQMRPTRISRLPTTETSFAIDVAPTLSFSIWPKCDQAYTLSALAYQYSPSLDGVIYSTNWLTENAPDILLFGALIEWASYMPHHDPEPRFPEWQRRWNDAVWTLYQSQEGEKYKGSYIYTKYFNPLNGSGGQSINYGASDTLLGEGGDSIALE